MALQPVTLTLSLTIKLYELFDCARCGSLYAYLARIEDVHNKWTASQWLAVVSNVHPVTACISATAIRV